MSLHPLDQKQPLSVDDLSRVPTVKPRALANGELENQRDDPVVQAMIAEYAADPKRLHGDKNPNFIIKGEKPEHRLLVFLRASGKTRRECAELLNWSYNWVCQVERQPWFRQKFIEVVEEQGKDVVQSFLQGEVLTSIETLVEIRDDESQKGQTRVSAANSILDRALGKPTQHVETENRNISVSQEDAALQREIQSLEERLKQSGN